MKCIYCDKPVFGADGVTVPKRGPAHRECFQANQAMQRKFKTLNISALNDAELTDLKDLVLAEINARDKNSSDEDVELF